METIFPALFRRVNNVSYRRQRIETPDNDFLDLDWSQVGSQHMVIISHGLEGNTTRPYIKGMVRAFNQHGIDALAWNFRGCGDEMNKQLRFYHSGATEDLKHLINFVEEQGQYQSVSVVGFSLGGNLTLKYLGEESQNLPPMVKAAVVFSVPIDLAASCEVISETRNFLYARRFLKSLKHKIRTKSAMMPDKLPANGLNKIKTLRVFDDKYTAPLHGFNDAKHYYAACSAGKFIPDIAIPTLLVSARNDPFLSPSCFPEPHLIDNSNLQAEYPKRGGHVGFPQRVDDLYWSEARAVEFVKDIIGQNNI